MELYHRDRDKLSFETRIRSVGAMDGKVYLTLNESWFYPEGGGQPADKGTINGREVLSVVRKDGDVFHELAEYAGLTINMPVSCVIDRDAREDHSAQHTAQHLLSAVLSDSFGANTVGFHLGVKHTTIDTDRLLSDEELRIAEEKVNMAIMENLKVTELMTDIGGLRDIALRKETNLTSGIRIVRIGDIDSSACGGTHIDSLGKLLILRIAKSEKYKDGSRIWFYAGKRAYGYILESEDILKTLRRELMAGNDELPFRVVSLIQDKEELERKNEELSDYLAEAVADSYTEDFVVTSSRFDPEVIRKIGEALAKRGKIAVLYREEDFRVYAFTGEKAHAGKLFSEAKEGYDFRGGGGRSMAQGYLKDETELHGFISRIYESLLRLEV